MSAAGSANGKSQAVLGYASKKDAVQALFAEGHNPQWIAREIGSTPAAVAATIKVLRQRGALPPSARPPRTNGNPANKSESQPGIWTAEKREKLRRLYGKTMVYIAEALQLPAAEVLHFVIHGTVPPSPEARRFAEHQLQRLEKPAAPPEPEEAPAATPTLMITVQAAEVPLSQELSREDDEAELERLAGGYPQVLPPLRQAAAETAPGEPAPAAYRLQDPDKGSWLDKAGMALTYRLPEAGKFTAQQYETIFKRFPRWKDLMPVRVP